MKAIKPRSIEAVAEKSLFIDISQGIKLATELLSALDVSENTREDYLHRVPVFLEYVKRNGLSYNTFLGFKRYLADLPQYSVSTKNKYIATARVLLKEMNKRGLLPTDITQNVKAFSQDKKHKRDGVSTEEVSKIMGFLKTTEPTKDTTKLKAILSLLILQGLRQVEITRLDAKDIHPAEGVAFVRGKGRDDKEPVFLHPETVKTLKEYMQVFNIKDGALFRSESNNSKNKRLNTRSVRGIVKELLTRLGIEKTTHGFRHYFTTTLIKSYKGDLTQVARYTRHRSLEMLQVYNDHMLTKEDLPRYFQTFSNISFIQ